MMTNRTDKIEDNERKVDIDFLNERKTVKRDNFYGDKRIKMGGNLGEIFFDHGSLVEVIDVDGIFFFS